MEVGDSFGCVDIIRSSYTASHVPSLLTGVCVCVCAGRLRQVLLGDVPGDGGGVRAQDRAEELPRQEQGAAEGERAASKHPVSVLCVYL